MMRLLQINLGRGRQAQDLLMQTCRERKADVALISEQYRRPELARWYQDVTGRAAIWVVNKDTSIRNYCDTAKGYTWVEIEGLRIYSCYFSPNDPLETLIMELEDLEDSFGTAKGEMLIAGDFNSKSPEWGSLTTDRRGALVTSMMARKNLIVHNHGGITTFRRGLTGSIIDLTLTTEKLARRVQRWKVLEEITLSDHQYIEFDLQESEKRSRIDRDDPGRRLCLSWNRNQLNEGALHKFLEEQRLMDELNWTQGEKSFQGYIKSTTQIVKRACDASMPRRKCTTRNRRPMYWWSTAIADLRNKCLSARRKYTRSKGDAQLKVEFDRARKDLKKEIRNSKRRCWEELIKTVENDPWGFPYRLVTKKLGTSNKTPGLDDTTWVRTVIQTLFPTQPSWSRGVPEGYTLNEEDLFTLEELRTASLLLKTKKAPGPDGVPNEVLKVIVSEYPELLLEAFNTCLKHGKFPDSWKIQKLILLRKGHRPLTEPSSFRPICLLDTMGKFLEELILQRLQRYVKSANKFSDNQFGFRKGRSTIDAIQLVVDTAQRSRRVRGGKLGFCALITIDIKNAFNCARWKDIIEALEMKKIPEYLLRMLDSYLSDRTVFYEGDRDTVEHPMTCGAPQGSKLGPFFWIAMYDDFLDMEIPENAMLIGFADDAIVICSAETIEELEVIVNDTLERVRRWLTSRSLEMAIGKTEAMLVTDRRSFAAPIVKIDGQIIEWKKSIKYLGLEIDRRLSFRKHIANVADKAAGTAAAISRLMPNVGGPKEAKRRLLVSVIHAKMLYAAPIWADALTNQALRRKMESVQRCGAMRVASAYRTVSHSAVLVVTSIPPIDLLALERQEVYRRLKEHPSEEQAENRVKHAVKESARRGLMETWQQRWNSDVTGRWTHELIPQLEVWVGRRHGEVNYYVTQALTGHGCFKSYLKRFNIITDARCDYCGHNEDDVRHSLFECTEWTNETDTAGIKVGATISAENLISLMVESTENWTHVETFITKILKKKEEDRRNAARNNPTPTHQADMYP